MEDNYKVSLFTRTGKGIELTDDGVDFLKHVEPIVEQFQILEERFSNKLARKKASPLRVGETYALSSSILSSLLAIFKKRFPDVEVLLRSNTPGILEQMILKDQLDVVLTSILPRSPELTADFCVPLSLVAFAAKSYPIANGKKFSLADLERIPLIIRDDGNKHGTTEISLLELRSSGYRPNIVMRCESPEAIKTAVNKKLGVGILYHDAVKDALAHGSFKQIHISGLSIEEKTYILCHKQRALSTSGEAFLKLLRERCEAKRTHTKNRTPSEPPKQNADSATLP